MWHSLRKHLGGARDALTSSTGPVFYDRTGKRLYYFIAGVVTIALLMAVLPVRVTPMAFDPLWTVPTNGDSEFPRQLLSSPEGQMPILGNEDDEVLSRVVRVDRRQGRWTLVDPFTNETYRIADDDDKDRIGDSDYAIDHYGRPAERQLMLTFDDGPDVEFTTLVLDILSREKVPATFFVVGSQVVLHPDVFRRMVREGHMAGNHTMFHIDFDDHTDFRNRQEIIAADRVMRATAGYASRLFRIPKGDPDNNTLALLQSQQLGYLQVDQDIDTLDWKVSPKDELAVPPLDGRGHVVLLHDGGGDRSATIRMLEKLIAEAKSKGYTFSTLAPLLPEHFQPVPDTKPYPADTATYRTLRLAEEAPGTLLGFLFWLGMGSLTVMSLLYLVLALISQYRQNRLCWNDIDDQTLPMVSVVLAAFNEEKVISRTIAELRRSDYPRSRFEVVAVNDGSNDDTLRILTELARDWPRLRVIDQPNSGKSSAINNGINHASPASTVIVTMDADTLFRPDTIRNLVRHFVRTTRGKRVGAVAGHIKVGNRRNLLTAWQSLEYISGICVTRMAERLLNAISIVPGACSAWSREALEQIGGFCDDTMAEDCDATLALQRRGYRILQENNAIADTEAPETIRALAKQRKRWTYGNIQALWKHRAMLFRPRYGALGLVTLPYATLSLVVPLLFMPLTVVAAGMSIAAGNWQSIALYAGFVAALHMIISITAVAMARERAWHLLVVPVYRIIYEPLRAYLLYASAYRALKGTIVAWDKLERRNSVSAFADRHGPIPVLGAQQ
ncbi:polysaccharide deacetylase [Mycobacterium sp. IS-1742]|uniref:bifunctional polysaccharide deacetylase/glycosyltransferase family 2 protein n=1 Tax=Mycobacterium sp. IS-1742 TaxID=1772285 RepID=UPI00073FF74C|nr:glycosyltransferase [Mycobacterium sp. IS-1742]KUI29134.1 polysaccharide deacetylase [Mycobacterium sp. IS-1742]